MMRRFKRPGYRILLAIAVVFGLYTLYRDHRAQERWRQKLEELSRSADRIFHHLQTGDYGAFQDEFSPTLRRKIDLERIATFVDTLHLDLNRSVHWNRWQDREGNLTLHGDLGEHEPVPVDLLLIRRGDRILLRAVRIGNKGLKEPADLFPLYGELPSERAMKAPKEENGTH